MNYIAEINAFNDWLLSNPLPTGAIALWYQIMSINNKAGWADEFTIANLTLQSLTGLSRQGLDRARNLLIQKGLIEYQKGTSNKAGKYRVISFECKKIGTAVGTKRAQQEAQGGHNSSTLNKLNQTKLNNNSCSSYARANDEPVDNSLPKFIEQEFGQMLNSTCIEQIKDWQSLYPDEMIRFAVEKAVLAGKKSYLYVNGIINSWLRNDIKTLDEAKRADEEFSREKKVKSFKRTKDKSQVVDSNKRDLSYLVE
jgi:DnaD/phage-associated family protein